MRFKAGVVSRDPRETTGARAVLNLGHTVGHAIEAAGAFTAYSHGEAIGLGLRAALWLWSGRPGSIPGRPPGVSGSSRRWGCPSG